jgi:hypothetical protein
MTQSSDLEEQHRKALREHLAQERASGKPLDTSWTDDLPDDPLPEEEGETSVVFLKKPK